MHQHPYCREKKPEGIISKVQLSGVQECRSDASLRSADDSAACIVETIVYTPTSYTPTLLKNTLLILLYMRKLSK